MRSLFIFCRSVKQSIVYRTGVLFIKICELLYPLCSSLWEKTRYDLIIVRCDRIGDFIISIEALRFLVQQFNGGKKLFICNSLVAEIAKKSLLFDNVLVIDNIDVSSFYEKPTSYLNLVRRLISIEADYLVNPMWSRLDPSDLIVKYISARNKYGCDDSLDRNPHNFYNNNLYTKLINNNPFNAELLSNQFFVEKAFNSGIKYDLPDLSYIYKKNNPLILGSYIVIAFSASNEERLWPIDRWANVLDVIPNDNKVVLLGNGIRDLIRADKLQSLVTTKKTFINMVGKTTIMDMLNIISNSRFLIGLDSAPVHIAAAARVRSICIAPGAHYNRFVPYPKDIYEEEYHPITISSKNQSCFMCNYKCTRKDYVKGKPLPCLMDVSSKDVVNEFKKNICHD